MADYTGPRDEFNEARAGDMEAAILDAIESIDLAHLSPSRATGRAGEILDELHERLIALMDEIGDARDGVA